MPSVLLGGVGVGPDQAENPVGLVGVRGPDLLAVDDVVVAAVVGARGERGEVRTGVRLGVPLAPADLAARDLRQVLALLRLVAELQQRRAEHPDAEAVERRAAAERTLFLCEHLALLGREATTAVFARPGRHGPAAFGHAFEPGALRVGRECPVAPAPAHVVFAGHRPAHLGRAVRLQPGTHFGAEARDLRRLAHGLPRSIRSSRRRRPRCSGPW